jgi:hypothetical protein
VIRIPVHSCISTEERLRRQVRAGERLRHCRNAWNRHSSGREAFKSVPWGEARLCVRHPKMNGQNRSARRRRASCEGNDAARFERHLHTFGVRDLSLPMTRGGARQAGLHPGLRTTRPFGLKRKSFNTRDETRVVHSRMRAANNAPTAPVHCYAGTKCVP